jgi:hypothetical protein
MTYHRRQHGLSAREIYLLEQFSIKMKDFLEILDDLTAGILLDCGLVIALMTFHSMLMFMSVERHDIVGINGINRNRNIDSFTEEECWHNLRFRKPDVHRLYSITQFPQIIRCENGTVCQGEYAFCLMLYRIAYPGVRLFHGSQYLQVMLLSCHVYFNTLLPSCSIRTNIRFRAICPFTLTGLIYIIERFFAEFKLADITLTKVLFQ